MLRLNRLTCPSLMASKTGIQVQVCLTQASDYVLWVTVILLMAMVKGVILKMKLLREREIKEKKEQAAVQVL